MIVKRISSFQDDSIQSVVLDFLRRHGFKGELQFSIIHTGANNQVHSVRSENGALLLKRYFKSPEESRDRFQAEKAFYNYLQGVEETKNVPKVFGWDDEHSLGLFEFVPGSSLHRGDVTSAAVEQCLRFFSAVNANRRHALARALPNVAEACFSLQAHLDCIGNRVETLSKFSPQSEIDRRAAQFVTGELIPAWISTRKRIEIECDQLSIDLKRSVAPESSCISPSDFGFHNAIRRKDGGIVFFDFEYAGWDDPAKTICDFFCQPGIPVSLDYWSRFTAGVDDAVEPAESFEKRARLLLPAYMLKWCCIVLNEFTRKAQKRRRFAKAEDLPAETKKAEQLEKAKGALADFLRVTAKRTEI